MNTQMFLLCLAAILLAKVAGDKAERSKGFDTIVFSLTFYTTIGIALALIIKFLLFVP